MQHEQTLSLDEPLIDHQADRGCEEPHLPSPHLFSIVTNRFRPHACANWWTDAAGVAADASETNVHHPLSIVGVNVNWYTWQRTHRI